MERPCGCKHDTPDEALHHAFESVTIRPTEPLIGTKTNGLANAGKVIGFKTPDGKIRIRLDFDPKKGLHVNEEDFTRLPHLQKVVHIVEPVASSTTEEGKKMLRNWQEHRMLLYWNKWTKRL